MLELRRADERGHADHGWLESFHTFSFADYHDPAHMGFGPLRVINEDRVAAGQGFGTHGHRDMEIITYVLAGELAHKDSMGNGSVIRPGDVQRMSAGTGVRHSEFNSSDTTPVHFLQIWIVPAQRDLAPSYEQRTVPAAEKHNVLGLIASQDGRAGSVTIGRSFCLTVSGSSLRKMALPYDFDIFRPSVPGMRFASVSSVCGSGKTSPYRLLKRRTISRVISTWGAWSSPTGTASAL